MSREKSKGSALAWILFIILDIVYRLLQNSNVTPCDGSRLNVYCSFSDIGIDSNSGLGDIYFGEPYADQKQLPKLNYADRHWYKGVTSTNHTSASIHEPATAIAVPVYNKAIAIDNTTKSHLSGYWVGVLDLRSISESIKKLDLNQNDRILIVDHTGTIINSHSGLLNTTSAIPMPTESIKSVLAGDAGSKIEIIDGTHILTNFQPLNAGTHIWGVVLVHPYH